MTNQKNKDDDIKEMVDLILSSLFSNSSSTEEDNLLDMLFLNEEDLENAFKKKDYLPKSENIEDLFSDIDSDSPFYGLSKGMLKGTEHHEKEKLKEMVDHPDHYNQTEIETIEKFILINHDRPEKIKGALEFNIIKYSDRVGKKDSTPKGIKEDNAKIRFYLDVYELLFPESVESVNLYKIWKESK